MEEFEEEIIIEEPTERKVEAKEKKFDPNNTPILLFYSSISSNSSIISPITRFIIIKHQKRSLFLILKFHLNRLTLKHLIIHYLHRSIRVI